MKFEILLECEQNNINITRVTDFNYRVMFSQGSLYVLN